MSITTQHQRNHGDPLSTMVYDHETAAEFRRRTVHHPPDPGPDGLGHDSDHRFVLDGPVDLYELWSRNQLLAVLTVMPPDGDPLWVAVDRVVTHRFRSTPFRVAELAAERVRRECPPFNQAGNPLWVQQAAVRASALNGVVPRLTLFGVWLEVARRQLVWVLLTAVVVVAAFAAGYWSALS